MKVIAIGKNIKGSARKARIPARVVIGMHVEEAMPTLEYMNNKASDSVYKVLKSAIANAEHNYKLKSNDLIVHNVFVDNAFKLRRFKAGSKGSPRIFDRRYCHITVELTDKIVQDEQAVDNKITKEEKTKSNKSKNKDSEKKQKKETNSKDSKTKKTKAK